MSARQPVRPGASLRTALLVTALLGVVPGAAAFAQDRSDTGRTRPPAPAPKVAPPPPPTVAPVDGDVRWIAGLGFGIADAGDLFRVETADGVAVPWGQDDRVRFTASRFTATVDPGSEVTAFAGRRLGGSRWWLRGELSRGASDVAAEALLGQGGEVFHFDRLTFLTGSLGAEARLTSFPSYPYGSFGLTVARMTAERATDLDQTGLGFQAGFGYRQRLGRAHLAVETQLRRIAIDIKDFRPSVATGSEPALVYEPADDLWLFEIRLVGSRAW